MLLEKNIIYLGCELHRDAGFQVSGKGIQIALSATGHWPPEITEPPGRGVKPFPIGSPVPWARIVLDRSPTKSQVDSNHGDRFRPQEVVLDRFFQMGVTYKWRKDPNYLRGPAMGAYPPEAASPKCHQSRGLIWIART